MMPKFVKPIHLAAAALPEVQMWRTTTRELIERLRVSEDKEAHNEEV